MRKGLSSSGFTFVEVMIVMTVSAALLISFIYLVSGSTQRSQFAASYIDLHSQINAIIDNVATGSYNNVGGFTCRATGASGPILTSGVNQVGANAGTGHGVGCIFIGQAIQFGPHNTNKGSYNVYDMVGQRQIDAGGTFRDVFNVSEARPKAIAPTSPPSTSPSTVQSIQMENGLTIQGMRYSDTASGTNKPTTAFVILSDFPTSNGSGGLNPGAKRAQLYAVDLSAISVPVGGFDIDPLVMADLLDYGSTVNTSGYSLVPTPEVDMCFRSGTTEQYYLMQIGGDSDSHQINLSGTVWGVNVPITVGNFVGVCG